MTTDNFENSEEVLEPEETDYEEAASEEPEEALEEGEENETEEEDNEEEALAEETEASEEEAEGEEEADNQKDPRLNRFFKKKNKKPNISGQKIEELTDKLKRQMAEFENFRKRTEKEKSQMYDMGAKSMLEKILPVVDNFERGLNGLPEEEENPFADGMKMVYKQLMTALTEAGVKEIEAVGQPFDPDKHNAVMHIDDDAYGENEIVEELQKGYTYHDAVVRYSMVKVAN